jgi:DNA-binding NarL/FixJ family response regulator
MKLLVVDDSKSFRDRLTRHLLDDPTIDVVGEADNGRDALLEIERLQPHIVLLDLEMPPPDGFGVLRAVKQRFHGTQVVVLTGNASTPVREQCLLLGADAVIDKGDTVALVIPTMRRVVGKPNEDHSS